MKASVHCALVLLVSSIASACTTVPAHQRARLAHPSMSPTFARSAALEHVYAIGEGARGGTLGAGSGCGCN